MLECSGCLRDGGELGWECSLGAKGFYYVVLGDEGEACHETSLPGRVMRLGKTWVLGAFGEIAGVLKE